MNSRLHPEVLIQAYSNGYFPMPDPNTDEIVWYRPNPRAILPLDGFHCSRSLARKIKKGAFSATLDQQFEQVMRRCAQRDETWITDEFVAAYTSLHRIGLAHSLEVFQEGNLVGGLYGVALGGAFFAESKFHEVSDASKAALYFLVERLKACEFALLEVQFITDHLRSLGAIEISDHQYQTQLSEALGKKVKLV